MNIDKHIDFFDPMSINERIHILGCGAVGSTIAEHLVRLGLTKLTLWDPGHVKAHNVANQMYRDRDIGRCKASVLMNILRSINEDIKDSLQVRCYPYEGQPISGWIILAIDNVDTVRQVIQWQQFNPTVKGFIDVRLGLMDGQHYAAVNAIDGDTERLLKTMDFTHEEAKANSPLSACGTSLCVMPGVRLICALAVSNFMSIMQGKPYKHMILSNAETFMVDAF